MYRVIPHRFPLSPDEARHEAGLLDRRWSAGRFKGGCSIEVLKGYYRISDRTGAIVVADRHGLAVDLVERPAIACGRIDEKAWMLVDRLYLQCPREEMPCIEPFMIDVPTITEAILAADSLREGASREP